MSNSVITPRVDASRWDARFPFDLLVAYEDRQTRNRALHLYDHLAQQLLEDYDFQCTWWKFGLFSDDVIRRQSADAALDANMVILSLHAAENISTTQTLWLHDWTHRRRHRKAALVTLIAGVNDPEKEAPRMVASLREAARIGGMDFFPHAFGLPLPDASQASQEEQAAKPMLQDILHHKMPAPRWGINE